VSQERQSTGDRRTSPYLLKPVRSLEEARAARSTAVTAPDEPELAERLDNEHLSYARARR
jgi:hypothetical protein